MALFVKLPSGKYIPYSSDHMYGISIFFKTGEIIPFNEARKFARSLKLKNCREWANYCKSGKKPGNIPSAPNRSYKDKGWTNWGDFLGTGNINPRDMKFVPFNEARKFVRSLKLKNFRRWKEYRKSGKKPGNIPSSPDRIYKDKGWTNWGDFLGTGNINPRGMKFVSFEEARAFARSLNLKVTKEWIAYCKSGKKPKNIPFTPHIIYKNKGWKGIKDFLGAE